MANGGKDIRLGDDKRPVTIIPQSEDNLYNVRNGEILTDEFGIPLTTEIEEIFVPDATTKRSTSVVFPEKPEDPKNIVKNERVGIVTATYGHDLDVYVSTTVAQAGGGNVSFASTIALASGGITTLELYPYVEVKTIDDQLDEYNRLYFEDSVGIKTTVKVQVGDQVTGSHIKPGTFVSKVNFSRLVLTKNVENVGTLTTLPLTITRKTTTSKKSINTWKVIEQFKETSEVSSSLLGIPRAETQLSLFSDVSSYGLDADEFEESVYNGGYSFARWENRANAIYGTRYRGKVFEEVQESAIRIGVFAAPYSFPFDERFRKLNQYDATLYPLYLEFIHLGLQLHAYYNTSAGASYPQEWKTQFLDPALVSVDENSRVIYDDNVDAAFASIDTWTDTWRSIKDKELIDPTTNELFDFTVIQALRNENKIQVVDPNIDELSSRPGYSSIHDRFAYLQSRRVFRYQPGRISGFTFGLKSSAELRDGSILEWGIKNPTDAYLFQIDKGNIKIVRRSTLALSSSVLARSGLTISDQVKKPSLDPFDTDPETGEAKEYFTIEVVKDNFNGDILNGNGPSGYNLLPENVTMYKIEFGWYGAIGVRFYAYVPIGNGECRWVVMHTLVIENQLSGPCLEDSYFRLFYSVNITNNELLRTPQFVYKYGSSYYIDGGDEGTSQLYSAAGITSGSLTTPKTLLGIIPKDNLVNQVGQSITNKKLIIPTQLNITSDALAKVEVVTCKACPGFGHVYTPGVASTIFGRYIDADFTGTNTLTARSNSNYFQQEDLGAKIIAPSIYNAYVTELPAIGAGSSSETATIVGFGSNPRAYEQKDDPYFPERPFAGEQALDRVTGIVTTNPAGATYPHTIRLSNLDGYMASNYKLTGSEITVQFLNPSARDSYSHHSDFLIGLTAAIPDVSLPNTLNNFSISGVSTTVLPKEEILYAEHTHTNAHINEKAVEVYEAFDGREHVRCEVDYRLPFVETSNLGGGYCSKVEFKVLDPQDINEVEEVLGSNQIFNGESGINPLARYLIKNSEWPANTQFDGGQVKVKDVEIGPNTPKYVGKPKKLTSDGVTTGYIRIDSSTNQSGTFTVQIRAVSMKAGRNPPRFKLFNYDPFPLYLVARLRDNAVINNISIKEKIAGTQKSIAPKLYVLGHHMSVTNAGGKTADNLKPTNFIEIDRQSSALVDTQNEHNLRSGIVKDTLYVGANSTNTIDMTPIFGQDRNVVTPDNLNTEATFITAKKIDSSSSATIEASINFKEQ